MIFVIEGRRGTGLGQSDIFIEQSCKYSNLEQVFFF